MSWCAVETKLTPVLVVTDTGHCKSKFRLADQCGWAWWMSDFWTSQVK